MKYNILGFDQQKLVDFKLSIEDAHILQWLLDWKNNGTMETIEINDEMYVWLKYDKIFEELPILGFDSKKTLQRKFNYYTEIGLLKKAVKKSKKGKIGTYTYFHLNEDMFHLLQQRTSVSSEQRTSVSSPSGHQCPVSTGHQRPYKDSSIRDSSIRDTTTKKVVGKPEEKKEEDNQFIDMFIREIGKFTSTLTKEELFALKRDQPRFLSFVLKPSISFKSMSAFKEQNDLLPAHFENFGDYLIKEYEADELYSRGKLVVPKLELFLSVEERKNGLILHSTGITIEEVDEEIDEVLGNKYIESDVEEISHSAGWYVRQSNYAVLA